MMQGGLAQMLKSRLSGMGGLGMATRGQPGVPRGPSMAKGPGAMSRPSQQQLARPGLAQAFSGAARQRQSAPMARFGPPTGILPGNRPNALLQAPQRRSAPYGDRLRRLQSRF